MNRNLWGLTLRWVAFPFLIVLSWFIEFQLWNQKALLTEFEDIEKKKKTTQKTKKDGLEEKIPRQSTKASTLGSTWSLARQRQKASVCYFYLFTFDTLQKESIIKDK